MTSKDSWNQRINMMNLSRLEERFSALFKQAKYREADVVMEKTIILAKTVFGPDHAYVTACMNNRLLVRKKLAESEKISSKKQEISFDKAPRGYGNVGKFVVSLMAMAVLLTTAFVYGAINLTAGEIDRRDEKLPESVTYPFYRVNAKFSPEEQTITGEEEIFFDTEGTGYDLNLNLYFNRYRDAAANKSEMRQYAYKGGSEQGYIDILSVSYKDKSLPFREEGEVLKITLEEGMGFAGQDGLKISFKIKIPAIDDRSGMNDRGVWLGNWLPTLTSKENIHKFTEIGDAFVNISSTYQVTMYVPQGYQIILSDMDDGMPQGSGTVYKGTIEHVRDLPVFINKAYQKISVMAGETQICYYYQTPEARPIEVAAMAQKTLEFYNSYVGPYPWKQLNIVENDMYLSGMEYSTMILLSTKALRKSLEETVFHEVGHQWFYNIVGSDQYTAAFIDEGLVEFLGYNVLKREAPQNHQNTWGLNKDLSKFKTWKQYRDVHYRNGRKVFENLYLILGKTEFEKFIKEYYDKYKYTLVTPEEFKAFLTKKIGSQKTVELLGY